MSETPHRVDCEVGKPHPLCDNPDCVAARAWEAMRVEKLRAKDHESSPERFATAEELRKAVEETLKQLGTPVWKDFVLSDELTKEEVLRRHFEKAEPDAVVDAPD